VATGLIARTDRAALPIIRRPALLTPPAEPRPARRTLDDSRRSRRQDERAKVIDSMRGTIELISAPSNRNYPHASRARCAISPRWHAMPGQLSNLASAQTDRELKQLQAETEKVRRRLYWQSLALIRSPSG